MILAAETAGIWPAYLTIILSLLFGYLSGSIPFGLLITKWAGHEDIRNIGSGNIGATNVLRTGSKKLAALTLLADIFKGLIPVLLVYWYTGSSQASWYAGFGAFLGHLYPLWLGFKGGKGVATIVGVLFGIHVWLGLGFALVWVLTAYLTRYSSLAALMATFTMTVVSTGISSAFPFIMLMAVLLFWRHKENITRLLSGEESKIGSKK